MSSNAPNPITAMDRPGYYTAVCPERIMKEQMGFSKFFHIKLPWADQGVALRYAHNES